MTDGANNVQPWLVGMSCHVMSAFGLQAQVKTTRLLQMKLKKMKKAEKSCHQYACQDDLLQT